MKTFGQKFGILMKTLGLCAGTEEQGCQQGVNENYE